MHVDRRIRSPDAGISDCHPRVEPSVREFDNGNQKSRSDAPARGGFATGYPATMSDSEIACTSTSAPVLAE
jgi:hypothetical protein